ncbi:DUF6274 family protein [Streptomyces sp. NPDC096153]|uniref:DUF6274 family protein n=1 Tax=Streptomyces sp. NPDC096153 TaxID=3155548 RepID=UPI00331E3782
MAASTARHETRALLRAHLAAVSGYRHLTRHCPVCHRLLRLAMDPSEAVPEESVPPPSAPLGGRQEPVPAPAVVSPENRESHETTPHAVDVADAAGTGETGKASDTGDPGDPGDMPDTERRARSGDEGPARA